MNTPPFLLGITMVFWGWQAGFLWLSVAGAAILEGSRVVRLRWEFSRPDLKRIVYLCDFLLAGGFVYIIYTTGVAHLVDAIMSLLRAMPLTVLPLIIAQGYSTTNKIDINMLTLSSHKDRQPKLIDVSYPYFGLCLLSAGAANVRTPWFYAGFSLLLAWVLWVHRPKIASPVVWIALVFFVGGIGYVGHIKLHHLQTALESVAVSFFSPGEAADSYKSDTAIGRIGALKLSDRILFRVKADTGRGQAPFLLQDAGYNSYAARTWFARDSVFLPVKPGQNGTSWGLQNVPAPNKGVTISAYLRGGRGILALPRGASHIENLPVGELKRSGLGTAIVSGGPALVGYTVRFDPDAPVLAPPKDIDLKVPQDMSTMLYTIVGELRLGSRSPREIVREVTGYFKDNFQYSTYKKDSARGGDPVEEFLQRSRSGHCEYFATATVLLLRAAGVPARYVTGYSVNEYSELEKTYVVRSKHAHAWAMAYIDGAWRDVDTTPSSWFDAEKDGSGLTVLSDLWSWLVFRLRGISWQQGRTFGYCIALIVVPVIILFVRRLYFKKRVFVRKTKKKQNGVIAPQQGVDSEFYAIHDELARRGLGRNAWEPLNVWIDRISLGAVRSDLLKQVVSLHYRYRFDPHGLSREERETLKETARQWLASIDRPTE